MILWKTDCNIATWKIIVLVWFQLKDSIISFIFRVDTMYSVGLVIHWYLCNPINKNLDRYFCGQGPLQTKNVKFSLLGSKLNRPWLKIKVHRDGPGLLVLLLDVDVSSISSSIENIDISCFLIICIYRTHDILAVLAVDNLIPILSRPWLLAAVLWSHFKQYNWLFAN